MKRVRVFLRTELFTQTGGDTHVPAGASVLDATVEAQEAGGFTVLVEGYADGRGRPLAGKPARLFLPGGKIDHMLLVEA
jgi:hypothetical protein